MIDEFRSIADSGMTNGETRNFIDYGRDFVRATGSILVTGAMAAVEKAAKITVGIAKTLEALEFEEIQRAREAARSNHQE